MVRTPDPTRQRDAERSDAQLDMLHSFAVKLNVLTDTVEIGNTITAELRTIVDYHNCRVYVLQDETRLMPIAFRGELTTEYAEEDLDTLITEIGEGITGTVAATREALLTPDAREVAFSVTIPGTDDDLLESMLAVPMVAGDTLVGVIVLSSLGYGMFDDEDQRMVEVLALGAGGGVVVRVGVHHHGLGNRIDLVGRVQGVGDQYLAGILAELDRVVWGD